MTFEEVQNAVYTVVMLDGTQRVRISKASSPAMIYVNVLDQTNQMKRVTADRLSLIQESDGG